MGRNLEAVKRTMLTISDWHQRYSHQAQWTAAARRYLINRFNLESISRCLDVGCGTGAVMEDISSLTTASIFGIDLELKVLSFAHHRNDSFRLSNANALYLPFKSQTFDFCFCHYLLLWLSDPLSALEEMKRVTRSGGYVFAFAEPDYAGRLDYPDELAIVGKIQRQSLTLQGANPDIGHSLLHLFQCAGFEQTGAAVLGGEWGTPIAPDQIELEWKTFLMDWDIFSSKVPKDNLLVVKVQRDLNYLENLSRQAWQQANRLIYVPTFFAWGKTP